VGHGLHVLGFMRTPENVTGNFRTSSIRFFDMAGLNRQAKVRGGDEWVSFGAVSFADAAAKMADRLGLGADKVFLTLRDEADGVEFDVTVECERAYKVSGLRGGD
jgi:hypothetical protein